MRNNLNNNIGCCGSVHGKTFEILLIVTFILTEIILVVNLILTMWEFKLSHYLFIIEICLIVLNGLCVIFAIILRCWRSDGSVLSSNYSSSYCLSVFTIILVVLNFLGSVAEEVLFYFLYYLVNFYIKRLEHDLDYILKNRNKLEKIQKILIKIMNNKKEEDDIFAFDKDDDEKKRKNKLNILKVLPWVSFNFNAFIQILAIIFIALIMKRINLKSDYGIPVDASSINGTLFQNGSASNIKIMNEYKDGKGETKKGSAKDGNGQIKKASKKKKKKKKKKHKSKDNN